MKNMRERVLELRAQDYTYVQIAKKLRITKGVVAGICYRDAHGKRKADLDPIDDRDLWILQLASDGWSYAEIAEWLQENGWPAATRGLVNGIVDRDRKNFPDEPLRRAS